jgi:hypothetical protein
MSAWNTVCEKARTFDGIQVGSEPEPFISAVERLNAMCALVGALEQLLAAEEAAAAEAEAAIPAAAAPAEAAPAVGANTFGGLAATINAQNIAAGAAVTAAATNVALAANAAHVNVNE